MKKTPINNTGEHRGTRQSVRLNNRDRAGRDGGRTGRGGRRSIYASETRNRMATSQGKESNAKQQGQKNSEKSSLAEKANITPNNRENETKVTYESEQERIKEGALEWDDAELLRQTTNRMRKGLADIDILEAKEENVRLIRGNEKRYKDLTIVETDESENEDEEMKETHLNDNETIEK